MNLFLKTKELDDIIFFERSGSDSQFSITHCVRDYCYARHNEQALFALAYRNNSQLSILNSQLIFSGL